MSQVARFIKSIGGQVAGFDKAWSDAAREDSRAAYIASIKANPNSDILWGAGSRNGNR